jgi:uncharacterized membrane protein YgcG
MVAQRPSTMKLSSLRLAAVPALFLVAACGAAPAAEETSDVSSQIAESAIISRGMEWVDAKLHYCQAERGGVDDDNACWGWEGPSHRCDRESNAAWNDYRSDCSGFVTWSWGLASDVHGTFGGYATGHFAPYNGQPYGENTVFSHTIDALDLQPGDALNKITPSASEGHIILFKSWVKKGEVANLMEEPGCSSPTPYAHDFVSNVQISDGDHVAIDVEGESFYAIRFDGKTGTTSGGGSSSSSTSGTTSSGGSSAAADACTEGEGFCTETLQCDHGHWIIRSDDPNACSTVKNVEESCKEGDGYCTATLQCDGGHWVPRSSDPDACTSGPR